MEKPTRVHRRSGVTLIEVVVSTALVGVVLSGALVTLAMSVGSHREAADHADAYAMAESLLDEVVGLPYEDPDGAPVAIGVESGEDASPSDRLGMDDVDDYHGWSASPPEERDGQSMSAFTGWSRSVVVELVAVEPAASGRLVASGADAGLKRVVVTVDTPDGDQAQAVAVCSRHGAHEAAPAVDRVWLTGLGVTLETNGSASEQHGTTVNEPITP